MQIQLHKLLTEIGLIATVGAGLFIWKNQNNHTPKSYNQYRLISKTELPIILERFDALNQDEAFTHLCESIEVFLEMSNQLMEHGRIPGGQFVLNRLCEEINKQAKKMIYDARYSRNTDIINASLICEKDELNYLSSHCENLLRNILLV